MPVMLMCNAEYVKYNRFFLTPFKQLCRYNLKEKLMNTFGLFGVFDRGHQRNEINI